jgi:hypothetical protein
MNSDIGVNSQINVYLKPRVPKKHEQKMVEHFPDNPDRIIDKG